MTASYGTVVMEVKYTLEMEKERFYENGDVSMQTCYILLLTVYQVKAFQFGI